MTHSTMDRLGVSKLETLFAEVGWSFREQFVNDRGIDAQVEIMKDNISTGKLIAIQIKSGVSYFSESDQNKITFRPKKRHVEYWLKYDLPVIITIYNPDEDVFYWFPITDDTIEKTKKGYKIEIPRDSVLSSDNCNVLKNVFRFNLPKYRFNKLLLDLEWMRLIEQGEIVYAEFDDWVNKLLSRTSIKIFCDTFNDHKEIIIPHRYWEGHSAFEILEMVIPWADFEMDEDGHMEYMEQVWADECYIGYDKEADEPYFTEPFETWYKPPEEIVPVGEMGGEVELYRVILKLNQLGISFLEVHDYLDNTSKFEKRSFSINDFKI